MSQRLRRFTRGRPSRAAALLVALSVGASAAGCKHHEEEPEPLPPGVTPAGLRADAERMIGDGRRVREQGMALRAAGGGGDDLILRGERMMAEGQELKTRAMMVE